MSHQETLLKAAELKQQIKNLQDEYDFMVPEIKEAVLTLTTTPDKPKVDVGEAGRFVVMPYYKWTYSSAVKETESALKKMKADEEAGGQATCEETQIIKFVPKKN